MWLSAVTSAGWRASVEIVRSAINEDARDREMFADVYRRLRRFASVVRARPGDDPDDLVQEALARAIASGGLARLDDPERYLRTVVYRLVCEELRKQTRWERAVPLLRTVTADTSGEGLPMSLLLTELDPTDRTLLFLVEVEQWPIRDAAALAGVRDTAARMRLVRARRRARKLLEEP